MFTGIIEGIGKVETYSPTPHGAVLTISTGLELPGLIMGESISINGTCLTIIEKNQNRFTVELSPETLDRTTFYTLRVGELVNLERALLLTDRLDGHFVTGHIDDTGVITRIREIGNSYLIEFSINSKFQKYLISKGSIAIDGISLTMGHVWKNKFDVSIIPHTWNVTILKYKKVGDRVNLEFDMVAKYIERFTRPTRNDNNITLDFLSGKGYN